MKILKLAISKYAPNLKDCVWLQPVKGGVTLRVLNNGKWQSLKLVNDKDTSNMEDDTVIGPIEVTDITALTPEQLDTLNCGDKVIKVTGKQKHTYVVSYKGDGVGEGLCLTYTDASTVETVSYDLKATGWEYNSTDKGELTPA